MNCISTRKPLVVSQVLIYLLAVGDVIQVMSLFICFALRGEVSTLIRGSCWIEEAKVSQSFSLITDRSLHETGRLRWIYIVRMSEYEGPTSLWQNSHDIYSPNTDLKNEYTRLQVCVVNDLFIELEPLVKEPCPRRLYFQLQEKTDHSRR